VGPTSQPLLFYSLPHHSPSLPLPTFAALLACRLPSGGRLLSSHTTASLPSPMANCTSSLPPGAGAPWWPSHRLRHPSRTLLPYSLSASSLSMWCPPFPSSCCPPLPLSSTQLVAPQFMVRAACTMTGLKSMKGSTGPESSVAGSPSSHVGMCRSLVRPWRRTSDGGNMPPLLTHSPPATTWSKSWSRLAVELQQSDAARGAAAVAEFGATRRRQQQFPSNDLWFRLSPPPPYIICPVA
jgi:hypothetical protein